jgi:hypothetical protein
LAAFKLRRTNKTDDWLTPPELVRSLGAFDLDPCASRYQSQPLAAREYKLPEQNGLLLPWEGRVWCNPPYSSMQYWIQKFMLHGNGVMICPMAADTRWFWHAWEHADGILFIRGRTRFISTQGQQLGHPMMQHVLIASGAANVDAIRRSDRVGILVTSREILPLTKMPERSILIPCQH